MTAPLAFILGLLSAFIISCSLAAWYYARARRRIKQIEKHIANYQAATKTVGAALDQVYAEQAHPKRIFPSKR